MSPGKKSTAPTAFPSDTTASYSIDVLFRKSQDKAAWVPPKAPKVLGELLDSRYMLPLLFPSDPRLLSALPGRSSLVSGDDRLQSPTRPKPDIPGAMAWRSRNRKLRQVGLDTLRWVDGVRPTTRWARPADLDDIDDEVDHDQEDTKRISESDKSQPLPDSPKLDGDTPFTRTRKPSARRRASEGEGLTTPIEK